MIIWISGKSGSEIDHFNVTTVFLHSRLRSVLNGATVLGFIYNRKYQLQFTSKKMMYGFEQFTSLLKYKNRQFSHKRS